MPRDLRVVSATAAGVLLAWLPPPSASPVRFYRVYRSTTPGLPARDGVLVKTVALSAHADDGFVAPITRLTTAAQLGDSTVTIDPTTGELQWIDASAAPGVTYQYSVVHVGNETKASAPSPDVAATVPGPAGSDTTPPELAIVSPTMQHWAAYPRVVLQYADSQSGVDAASVTVSFNAALGDPANGGRAAGADVADLATWKDGRLFVSALAPPYSLPVNTLVTMTATVADNDGNAVTKTAQFFVTTTSAALPTAAFTVSPASGDAPLDVGFDATASTDPGGKVVQYEWYFGDGSIATGATASHRYEFGGSFVATLVVRDTEGGVATATGTITTEGAPPECANGDVRACYTGPDDTVGLGACVAGVESCLGGAWQPSCSGEIVPADEICDDGADNDCDGIIDVSDPDCGEDADAGCGCQSSGSPAAGSLLLIALLSLTRRRRPGPRAC